MNKVVLMGRLTRDPELRLTKTNKSLAQFTLAVNRRRSKDGTTGADFIQVVAWEKLADFCGKYLRKGQQISLVGKNTSRTWEDAEGRKHYSMEVVANEMFFADAKNSDKSVTHGDTDFEEHEELNGEAALEPTEAAEAAEAGEAEPSAETGAEAGAVAESESEEAVPAVRHRGRPRK